ncbi:MAG TPA: amino acid adenylation domain-containing protein, partial [Thermoanaerobaculia bacterium]|nr:amino acid adenylation domain-containing protein [Thermoanaerobaculia bacterium]
GLVAAGRRGAAPALEAPRRFDALSARAAGEAAGEAARQAEQRSEEYWRQELAGLPVLDLPTDRPRPRVQTFRAARATASYGEDVLAALRGFGSSTGSTMFMSVLTGLALLLHRLSGQDDLVVGVNALVPDGDAVPLVGFHTHPVVIRSRLAEEGLTLRQQIAAMRRRVAAAYQHQNVSLPRVLRALGVRRDPGRPPLAAVVFNMDRAKPTLEFDDLEARTATLPSGARVELTVNVSERADELYVTCDFNSQLYRAGTVEGWLGELRRLLVAMAEDPERPVAELLVAPPAPAATATGPGELPLTRYQQLMWMAQQLEPDSPQLGAPFLHLVPADLDAARFRRAWEGLVASSDALRTVFAEQDGAPVQRVLDEVPDGHRELDLSAADDPRQELMRWARERGAAPLPLGERCFDSVLVRLGPESHAWYLNTHHLVADAWSLGLVFRRLGEFYELAGEGRLEEAPALPPFGGFVAAETAYLASEAGRQAEAWWRERLADTPEAPAFFGRMVPKTTTRVERVSVPLNAERGRRLAELAAAAPFRLHSPQASLANLFTALVTALVHRLSGARRLALGTPYHNRRDAERRAMVGTLMQIVPLHLEVRPGDSLAELAGRVAAAAETVRPYREHPVGNPVERPAYHVECNFIVADLASFAGVPAEVVWLHPGHGRESLAVHARDFAASGALEVDFDFHTQVFDPQQRRLAVAAFLRLVDGWLAAPERPLAAVELVSGEERRELLEERNRTAVELPAGTFVDRFEEATAGHPQQVAVRATGAALTYQELERRSAALARRLAGRGVGPEDVVAVLAPRSAQFLTALLGVLRAGGVYLPLDPASPPARLARVLDDSAARVVLVAGTPAVSAARVAVGQAAAPVEIVEIGPEVTAGLAGEEPAAEPAAPLPDQLAYVIYTSGSTGAPKGAMVTHRGMLNHLVAKVADLGLGADDVVVQNASQSFDISVWQFLAPLTVGATVVVADDEEVRDPGRLLGLARRNGVTVLETVPALLREVTAAIAAEGEAVRPERLRWMLSTGEALPVDLWRDWLAAVPGVPLVNAYGPTECSDDITHAVLAEPPAAARRLAPVGRPVANTRLYVLEDGLRLAPEGLPGELYAAGAGVGRGYVGDPARTAAAFLPDPFATAPGERMYRTGDVARWAGGDLEVLGRVDQQLKLRGHRIEPGEVESALREHPAVGDAVVMARSLGAGGTGRALVAWIVVAGEAPATGDLRSFLAQRLPDAMVPAAFVALDALPLTTSGKVDRRALPDPSAADLAGGAEYEAPRDEAERTLAALWADVLGRERVGIHDDFFEIGGDSILALQIVSRASRAGLRLSAAQLFQHPTVARLAVASHGAEAAPAEQGAVVGEVPLTPVQHWFFELAPADPHHYNQAVLLALRELLAPGPLRGALARLVDHHDALRARFEPGEPPRQRFVAPGTVAPPYALVDLAALPEERRRPALEAAARAVQPSLDLAAGPLLRVVHFRLGHAGERLLLVAHHLVVDGVSWRVLLEDLEIAYRALAAGAEPALPPKTSSLRAWAEKLVERAASGVVQTEGLEWLSRPWRQVRSLPEELPGGDNTAASTEVVSVSLDPEETRRVLQVVPQRLDAGIDAVLLGALAHVLNRWSGGRFGTVELESHGRHDFGGSLDLSRTVGWFTSMYPVILEADPQGEPAAAVAGVQRHLAEIPEQGLSFGLLRHLGGSPTAQRVRALPRPQVGFNYLGQLDAVFHGSELFLPADEATGRTTSRRSPRPHLLDVAALVADGRLQVHWSYSRNLHRRATVEKLAAGFLEALRTLAAEGAETAETHAAETRPAVASATPAAEAAAPAKPAPARPAPATPAPAAPAAPPDGLSDFGWDDDDLAELRDAIAANREESLGARD